MGKLGRHLSQEQEQNQNKQQEQQEQDEEQQWSIEDQEHLETCRGYSELWDGLGPLTEQSRIRYFMRVKLKRLKQQQQIRGNSSSRADSSNSR